ncbi:MAG: RIP metalloprotease RseP [Acholeplasmataceae bacterium]|jgi:regulator of sigma E protease
MAVLIFLLNLIVFILVLGIIILLHELGHFFVAKKFNVLCHEFSIGMGPAIYQKRKGETIYSIRSIPIGGYVSIAGEDNDDALFKVGDMIGLRVNQDDQVEGIVLHESLQYDVIGQVISFELFDRDQEELHIRLELEDGTINRYLVLEDAKYYFEKEKQLQITTKERSLSQKPKWQRFLVLFAGAFMNFVLAFFLLILGYAIIGKPVEEARVKRVIKDGPLQEIVDMKDFTVESVNGNPINTWADLKQAIYENPGKEITLKIDKKEEPITVKTRIAVDIIGVYNFTKAEDNKPSEVTDGELIVGQSSNVKDGSINPLETGDKILKVNGAVVLTWQDLIEKVENLQDTQVTIEYLREGEVRETTYGIFPADILKTQGYAAYRVFIGVEQATKFNLGYALQMGFVGFGQDATAIFKILGALFTPNSGVSVKNLAGPVGIFTIISRVRSEGFAAVLLFMAFLSVNVGLINLLPIPALDGGRILFLIIEAIIRRPLNKKVETWVNGIAFILLMILFVYILGIDILRIIRR